MSETTEVAVLAGVAHEVRLRLPSPSVDTLAEPLAVPLLILIGSLAGFFVVPMNALLQHRGHILMGAGHSIAVQNFNENLSILIMTGLYSLLIWADLSVFTVITLFGLFVAGMMYWVKRIHEANQRERDDVSLLDDSCH